MAKFAKVKDNIRFLLKVNPTLQAEGINTLLYIYWDGFDGVKTLENIKDKKPTSAEVIIHAYNNVIKEMRREEQRRKNKEENKNGEN